MRPIDGDALMEILTTAIRNMKGRARFIGAENDPEIQMEIKAYTDIAVGVKNMPTIDPERKTGKWNVLDECANEGIYCSNCGKKVFKYDFSNTMKWKNFRYCPNCGAKMEVENESNSL